MKYAFLLTLFCGLAFGQSAPPRIVVKVDPVQTVTAKPGQVVHVTISATIDPVARQLLLAVP